MLFATTESGNGFSGHINDIALRNNLNLHYNVITEIQADGDELQRCCDILGRKLPYGVGCQAYMRVYTFLGNNAQEIAKNWGDTP